MSNLGIAVRVQVSGNGPRWRSRLRPIWNITGQGWWGQWSIEKLWSSGHPHL